MQSKGAISLLAVLIALACLYQLSFTAVSVIQQNKADKFAEAAVMAEQQKPSFAEVSELDKAYYLDSIRKERNRYYIDSVSAEVLRRYISAILTKRCRRRRSIWVLTSRAV